MLNRRTDTTRYLLWSFLLGLGLVAAACSPTPRGEVSESDRGKPGKVTIRWGTESEQDCYGYNIYRAAGDGKFSRVNKQIIAGGGTTHVPQRYELIDQPLPIGSKYKYKIEQVDLTGAKRDLMPIREVIVRQPADAGAGKSRGE